MEDIYYIYATAGLMVLYFLHQVVIAEIRSICTGLAVPGRVSAGVRDPGIQLSRLGR